MSEQEATSCTYTFDPNEADGQSVIHLNLDEMNMSEETVIDWGSPCGEEIW